MANAVELYGALRVLGLSRVVPLPEVEAAWQRLALVHHPDHGGDAGVFQTILRAYRLVKAELSRPLKCSKCSGTGRVTERKGWGSVALVCGACNGLGEQPPAR